LKRAIPVGDLSAWKARGKILSFQDPSTSALDFTTLLSRDSIRWEKEDYLTGAKPTIRRSTAAWDSCSGGRDA